MHLRYHPTISASICLPHVEAPSRPATKSSGVSSGQTLLMGASSPLCRRRIGSPWATCTCCSSDATSSRARADRRRRPHNRYQGVCSRCSRRRGPTVASATSLAQVMAAHVRPAEMGGRAEVRDCILVRANILNEKIVHLVLAVGQLTFMEIGGADSILAVKYMWISILPSKSSASTA